MLGLDSNKARGSPAAHSAASRRLRCTLLAMTMIDYARPYEQNMCDLYPTTPAPARLDDFQVFRKGSASYIYSSYYTNPSYDVYADPDIDSATNVYHNLVSTGRDFYYKDSWKYNVVTDWTEDDTVSWIIDTAQSLGFSELDIAYYNFKISGFELRAMKKEELLQRIAHPQTDLAYSRRIGEAIFEKLQFRLNQEAIRQSSVFRYADSDPYQHHEPVQTVLDLDSFDRNRVYTSDYKPNDSSLLQSTCDSSDDAEDIYRSSETASPEYSYKSDGSKSGDEDDKRKVFKRPPGRPKGSGRKICKKPKSLSVPDFLWILLGMMQYNPSIIKWEERNDKKFRFTKPDEVAKLWGKLKQNENMTFEKFSRAMRYHYKNNVLVSVPTARLVYQFGPKGPSFNTDDPKYKTMLEL